jgi:subtilisin family serine protease
MGTAMAIIMLLPAGLPTHAGAPAKSAPPPKASLSVLSSAAQGEVRVLVRVNEPATKGMSASAMRTADAVALDFADRSPHRYTHIPFLAMTVDAADLARLQNDPRIAGIEEDRLNQITLTDTMPLIGAPQAWAGGYSGAGQSIAILDTGFDTTHPMLQGKVVAEACFSQPGTASLCPNGQTQQIGAGAAINCNTQGGSSLGTACMHGTHVAGIALGSSAVLSGVAPGANLVAIQVFSRTDCSGLPCLTARDSDILKGLDQAYAWRTSYNIAAVSMSLGGSTYATQAQCDAGGTAYKSIFALFNQAGIPVAIASGNAGQTNAISIPACLTGVVSAGATTKADTVASYSNSADFLTLLAPGSSIASSVPSGYGVMSGTSMSAPHIAGAIAVLKSKMPNASVMQLIETLQNSGVPITDTRPGAGNRVKKRIALMAALNALDPSWKSDAFEPDDAPAQAQAIALSTPQTHRFGVPDDRDWVMVQALAGTTYRFETLNLSAETDTMLALYAGAALTNPVASNDDVVAGIDVRSVLTYTAPSDGPLYLQVLDWDAAAFLNTRYDVHVTQVGMPTPTSQPPTGTAEPSPSPVPSPSASPAPSTTPFPTATPQPTAAPPAKPKFKLFLPLVKKGITLSLPAE